MFGKLLYDNSVSNSSQMSRTRSVLQNYSWSLGYLFYSLNHLSSLGSLQHGLPIGHQAKSSTRTISAFTGPYLPLGEEKQLQLGVLLKEHKCHEWDLNPHPDVLSTGT